MYACTCLCASPQRVTTEEARDFALSVGALYYETSAKAKDGLPGIEAMFAGISQAVPVSSARAPPPRDATPDLRARPKREGGGCPC